MKNPRLLLFMIIACGSFANARNSCDRDTSSRKFSTWGISASYDRWKLLRNYDHWRSDSPYKPLPGFTIGISYELFRWKHCSFETGLLLSTYGWRNKLPVYNYTSQQISYYQKEEHKLYIYDLPCFLSVKMGSRGGWSFLLTGGSIAKLSFYEKMTFEETDLNNQVFFSGTRGDPASDASVDLYAAAGTLFSLSGKPLFKAELYADIPGYYLLSHSSNFDLSCGLRAKFIFHCKKLKERKTTS